MKIAVPLLILIAVFSLTALPQIQLSLTPWLIDGDELQQIWPMEPGKFDNDYIAEYYREAILPAGYQIFYDAAGVFFETKAVSTYLPVLLWLLSFSVAALILRQYGNYVFVVSGLGVLLLFSSWLDSMIGGLPRAFGVPIAMLAIFGFVKRSGSLIIVSALLSTLFYPVLLPTVLLYWAASIIELLLAKRISSSTLFLQILIVSILVVFIAYEQVPGEFGERVVAEEAEDFPEAGDGGRYNEHVNYYPEKSLAYIYYETIYSFSSRTRLKRFVGEELYQIICLFISLVSLLALFVLPLQHRKTFILLISLTLLSYTIASISFPLLYFPFRQLTYFWPIIILMNLIICSGTAVKYIRLQVPAKGYERSRYLIGLISCVLLIFLGSGHFSDSQTEQVELMDFEMFLPLSDFLKESDATLVAAWPIYTADSIPYFSGKSILFSYETHQALHKDYIRKIRERATGFFDAYFSVDSKVLVNFAEKFAVSHLVYNRSHFERQQYPLYFEPFQTLINDRYQKFVLLDVNAFLASIQSSVVYEDNYFIVIDLRKLQ